MLEFNNFNAILEQGAQAINTLSSQNVFFRVIVFSLGLALVSIFIWNFYNSTSKRDLLGLNLRKYNKYSHPLASKLAASALYFLEYVVIVPALLVIWFAALSIVLFLIAGQKSALTVLLISAVMIASIRLLSYFHEEIAKDLAKLFPFMALSMFILSPNAFDFAAFLDKLSQVPRFIEEVASFIVLILAIEIVLRLFYLIYEIWESEEESNEEREEE